MLIAVTNSDETNMTACQVAHTLFNTPTKISRIRSGQYLKHPELFDPEAFAVDVLISPEQVVTEYIQRLMEYPGALQVLEFADKKVLLVAIKTYPGSPLVGRAINSIKEYLPESEVREATVYAGKQALEPKGNTVIEADFEIVVVADKQSMRCMIMQLRPARDEDECESTT